MKKSLIVILLFVLALNASSQSRSDQTQVVQQCIDYPAFEQYFPIDEQKNPDQLVVLYYHPQFFPIDLPIKKFGKEIKFVTSKQLAELKPKGYFLFKRFEIRENQASVIISYNYTVDGSTRNLQYSLFFENENDVWKLSRASTN
jgi:hypothetical protein